MDHILNHNVSAKDYDNIAEGRYFAVSAYCFIFCLIPLFIRRDSPFVQFHAKQGLLITLIQIGLFLLWTVIHILPPLQFLTINRALSNIVKLVFFFFSTYIIAAGTFQAVNGEYYRFPLIGAYSEKISAKGGTIALIIMTALTWTAVIVQNFDRITFYFLRYIK